MIVYVVMKNLKKVLKALIILIIACIVSVLLYVAYVMIQYYRIEDLSKIDINNKSLSKPLELNKDYTVSTYNVGFGAYDKEYTFFLDEGEMKDGTKTVGHYGRARDKESVLRNINGAISVIKNIDSDFTLLQEVDFDSTRSYKVDQRNMFDEALDNMTNTYALNFHSSYSLLPLNNPHGIANAGLLTYSKYGIESAIRHNYPVPETFPAKYLDLDRCFSANYIDVENGKQLVLVNSHLSAYDEGGLIRKQQLKTLNEFIEQECKKGNYIIVGGDFNHALGKDVIEAFPTQQKIPPWVNILDDECLTDCVKLNKAVNQFEIATCRGADIPYEKGVTYETVIDGFIISNNIEATTINIDTDYEYSDHQPVLTTFKLL